MLLVEQLLEEEDSADEDFWNQDFFQEEKADEDYKSESSEATTADEDFSESVSRRVGATWLFALRCICQGWNSRTQKHTLSTTKCLTSSRRHLRSPCPYAAAAAAADDMSFWLCYGIVEG